MVPLEKVVDYKMCIRDSIVSTHADAHITGHVVDASTGKHIAGATIIIQQYNVSVTTDASGPVSYTHLDVYKRQVGE